ncbi:hypothetical protein BTVI_27837 [Pitangus sulphuratus]|nr:hypothetical protein BTVI_27837 [Pitangus sulphuratus]
MALQGNTLCHSRFIERDFSWWEVDKAVANKASLVADEEPEANRRSTVANLVNHDHLRVNSDPCDMNSSQCGVNSDHGGVS